MGFTSYYLSLSLYIMSSCLMRYYVRVYIIFLEFMPLHHVILPNALLCSYGLNTLDAGRSRSMCGVIVVDAESFGSTCLGRDAYIHDHCLDMFITMLNSVNCSTVICSPTVEYFCS